jgi:hypothetical protein
MIAKHGQAMYEDHAEIVAVLRSQHHEGHPALRYPQRFILTICRATFVGAAVASSLLEKAIGSQRRCGIVRFRLSLSPAAASREHRTLNLLQQILRYMQPN